MNNKTIVTVVVLLALAASAYFIFTTDTTVVSERANKELIVLCDENGNHYNTNTNTNAEAEAAGLTPAQYGATYCPEYVAANTGDYTGLTVPKAEEIAVARQEPFRVIEIDGEPQPTTRDFQAGRINATVNNGIITSFSMESNEDTNVNQDDTPEPVPEREGAAEVTAGAHDAIIGMLLAEAQAYAASNDIAFRVGIVDGVGQPVTMDYLPGRITAATEADIVVGYTVE